MIIQKILFTKEECDKIINLKKINSQKWSFLDRDYNSNLIVFNEETGWIFDRLKDFFEITCDTKIIKLKQDIHFHYYCEGDFFGRHNDAKKNRIYGVGVLLNEEFMGGDFIFYDKNPEIINKIKGNSYVFDVITNHEIKPIINGIRHSLLWFLDNNNIKISKTNLL
jgi:hypothetical protein